MGVQFEPIRGLLAPYLGKFWSLVESDYPKCRENPPIVPQIEDLDKPHALKRMGIEISPSPDLPRVFLEDEAGNWLIQIQRDRFLHNWRVASEESEYPRYPEVRKRFLEQWQRFTSFLDTSDLGAPRVNQLEITYFNRIPLGSSRITEVFPDVAWRSSERVLSTPEAVEVAFSFRSEKIPKRLRATIRPSMPEGKPEMRFELTVRGMQREQESLEEWFDAGRVWIVTAFADLTSPEWHEKWGRTA